MPNRETESTLTKLSQDFQTWGETRIGMTAYPDDLKQRAVELCRYYSMAYVAKHIGVERGVVSGWVKAANNKQLVKPAEDLKLPPLSATTPFFEISQTPQIVIEHQNRDGSILRISGALNDKAVLEFLSRMKH